MKSLHGAQFRGNKVVIIGVTSRETIFIIVKRYFLLSVLKTTSYCQIRKFWNLIKIKELRLVSTLLKKEVLRH